MSSNNSFDESDRIEVGNHGWNAFQLSNGWVIAKFEDSAHSYIEVYTDIHSFERVLEPALELMDDAGRLEAEYQVEYNQLGVTVPNRV